MQSEHFYSTIYKTWKQNLEVAGKPNEWEVKQLMRQAGLPVPDEYLLRAEETVSDNLVVASLSGAAEQIYAVKLCSPDVLHKTDVGGVVLGVGRLELQGVLDEMRSRFAGEHLLISPMIRISGPEFILGALADPDFGPTVMAGAGGILTELYKDVAFRLAPCDMQEAGNMLDELTIAPVLSGYRGNSMDKQGLKQVISLFSHLSAEAAADGAQLDINPLIWTGSQWLVLDAKAVL